MISDVPVGVLLSGGVDSTGVLRHAVQQTDKPIHTFTIGFSGASFEDERPYARLVSEKFGTVHHEISMHANDFREFLPKYVWHMEDPSANLLQSLCISYRSWRGNLRSRCFCRGKEEMKPSAAIKLPQYSHA